MRAPRPGRPQVLVVMLAPPLPPLSGGEIYSANAVLPFADVVDYHLFCFVGGAADEERVRRNADLFGAVFRSVHLERRPPVPVGLPRVRRTLALARLTARNLPFADASYYSPAAVRAARRIVREHGIDALEVHSAHLAFFRRYLPPLPALLVSHNIEADLFPFDVPEGGGLPQRFVRWVARRSRAASHDVEIENSYGFDAMTFISRGDLRRVTADVPKHVLPLSMPVRAHPAGAPGDPFRVLWMGGFGWRPNAEGVLWFVREVYPLLAPRLAEERIVLEFCGGDPPDELRRLHDGVTVLVHGFVDDLASVLDRASLLMVPLLSGGGIRVKIVEAMSAGVPVLSTSKGCEGIGAQDGVDILVRDTPQAFADAILEAARQPSRLAGLAAEASRLMDAEYSPAAVVAAKRKAYADLGIDVG